jgi:Mrp family chromosome partitioning ATPase
MVPTVHAEGNWPDTLDGLVLVIEWGRVPGSLVESGLNSLGPVRKGFLGFVFNKVSPAKVDQSAFPIDSYRWKLRSKSR